MRSFGRREQRCAWERRVVMVDGCNGLPGDGKKKKKKNTDAHNGRRLCIENHCRCEIKILFTLLIIIMIIKGACVLGRWRYEVVFCWTTRKFSWLPVDYLSACTTLYKQPKFPMGQHQRFLFGINKNNRVNYGGRYFKICVETPETNNHYVVRF